MQFKQHYKYDLNFIKIVWSKQFYFIRKSKADRKRFIESQDVRGSSFNLFHRGYSTRGLNLKLPWHSVQVILFSFIHIYDFPAISWADCVSFCRSPLMISHNPPLRRLKAHTIASAGVPRFHFGPTQSNSKWQCEGPSNAPFSMCISPPVRPFYLLQCRKF